MLMTVIQPRRLNFRKLIDLVSCRFSNVTDSRAFLCENVGTIRVKNSLISSTKSPPPSSIVPSDSVLTWYSCGPTVYDAAHIGHARTYVCTDIIRRILTDIYNQDINFAVGVTDIDDKIIDRALVRGLKDWSEMEEMVRNLEDEFFDDLDALNVRRPDAVLRVTEHIDEIIKYIEGINLSGRSYETPDGVYFSVASCGDSYIQFQDPPSTSTSDSSIGVIDDIQETETEASSRYKASSLGYKRDRRDFALWKSVKEGEPSWDSPWGAGRPGWHIECSAMTHSYFGPKMDIHSGGVDLRFPHHTNEIAQCAAHDNIDPAEWVKYWMHTGHLYIEGRKMSKSLKNFISIKDFISGSYSTHPALDFRIFCLQYKYHSSVHFSQDRIDDAKSFRRKVESYLALAEAVTSSAGLRHSNSKVSAESVITALSTPSALSAKSTKQSRDLKNSLSVCRKAVSKALADDFDTPEALRHMSYLLGDAIRYTSLAAVSSGSSSSGLGNDHADDSLEYSSNNTACSKNSNSCDISGKPVSTSQPLEPILAVSQYVTMLLGKLGLSIGQDKQSPSSYPSSVYGPSVKEGLILDSLLDFRSKVRSSSLNGMKQIKTIQKNTKKDGNKESDEKIATAAKGALQEVLTTCDWVRDSVGPKLGIQIEDVSGALSIWRPAATNSILETADAISDKEK